MANGFPEGNFRIVNKETGACIASADSGYIRMQDVIIERGETGRLAHTNTADRQFTVHDKVKNIEEELWYFDSQDSRSGRENKLYNKVKDIRSSWGLRASVEADTIAHKLYDKDLESFISLLPQQDEKTLAYLRTNDSLNIVNLLKIFFFINGRETIKSELVGKLDETKLNEYLNAALAYKSIRSIEKKFYKYATPPFLDMDKPADLPEDPYYQQKERLYKIILASEQLYVLDRKDFTTRSEFRLHLRHDDINELLEKLKKEKIQQLQSKAFIEFQHVKTPQQEAVKIILELRKILDLHADEKNMNTAKKILQTCLHSNESFEQLRNALKSTDGKEKQTVHCHNGDVFLQASAPQYLTKWAFEDGYIFVEGQPDAVLTHLWGSYATINQRSNDPNQRWELKKA